MKNAKVILVLLILLGAGLRFLWLGQYPSGFFRDEAALGYNAYSVWQTGRDEYGVLLPLVFRSFEVFFLPLYVYMSAPLVGILGLNVLTARLLSSLSGIVLLFLGYFIARELWNRKVALAATFLLVISPWHIFYSRGAFEGNLALTLFAAGFLFWLKFLKKFKPRFFFASAALFALSMYSYQAERVVVPLFALTAAWFVRQKLWKHRKGLILPLAAVFILLLPLLSLSGKAGGYHRAFGVSIFTQEGTPLSRVSQVSALYLSYFSPRNLFIEGDFDRQRSVENASVFYAWILPFLALGLWRSLKKPKVGGKLLLAWMLIAPAPAAVTGDPFHTYRSLLLYLPLSLLSGLGLVNAFELFKQQKKAFLGGLFVLGMASLLQFLFSYSVLTQATRARAWDYGYREMVANIADTLPEGTRIVVDDPWTEAYIHFLFYGKVDPKIYHAEVARLGPQEDYYYTNSDEIRPNKLGSWEFRPVDWPSERGNTGTVFIIWAERLPESEFKTDPKVELLREIYYPNGKIAYRIVRIL